jgi:hypothetical protein
VIFVDYIFLKRFRYVNIRILYVYTI